jgi:hypothetical protein
MIVFGSSIGRLQDEVVRSRLGEDFAWKPPHVARLMAPVKVRYGSVGPPWM